MIALTYPEVTLLRKIAKKMKTEIGYPTSDSPAFSLARKGLIDFFYHEDNEGRWTRFARLTYEGRITLDEMAPRRW